MNIRNNIYIILLLVLVVLVLACRTPTEMHTVTPPVTDMSEHTSIAMTDTKNDNSIDSNPQEHKLQIVKNELHKQRDESESFKSKKELGSKSKASQPSELDSSPTPTVEPVFDAAKDHFIDAHLHLPPGIDPTELFDQLADAGISGAFVFGKFETLRDLKKKHPKFVYAFPQLRRDSATKELMLDEEMFEALGRQLDSKISSGVGEVSLRHQPFANSPKGGDQNPVDSDEALQLFKLAGDKNKPIFVHIEKEFSDELRIALEQSPSTKVIWGHMGDATANLIREMLEEHSNLYVDISCRNPIFPRGFSFEEQSLTDGDGTLKEEWYSLFEDFPQRFLFGTDIGTGDRHEKIKEIVEYYRMVLSQLTPATAHAIASKNAEVLLY